MENNIYQREFNEHLHSLMNSENVDILEIISSTQFDYLKKKIQPLFGVVSHAKFGITPMGLLFLYKAIYTDEVTSFSVTNLGILSDMFQLYVNTTKIDEIEDLLQNKQEMMAISNKYHEIRLNNEKKSHLHIKSKIRIN